MQRFILLENIMNILKLYKFYEFIRFFSNGNISFLDINLEQLISQSDERYKEKFIFLGVHEREVFSIRNINIIVC